MGTQVQHIDQSTTGPVDSLRLALTPIKEGIPVTSAEALPQQLTPRRQLREAVGAVITSVLGSKLDSDQVNSVASVFDVLPLLPRGAYVHRIGEPPWYCFLVLEGEVTL